jgi:hypothetical protein
MPSQLTPVCPLSSGRHSLLCPWQLTAGQSGSFDAAVHVPTLPGTLHAAHKSVHAESQHTPSTQLPVLQSELC